MLAHFLSYVLALFAVRMRVCMWCACMCLLPIVQIFAFKPADHKWVARRACSVISSLDPVC